MDILPYDVLAIITNKTSISTILAWAIACVKVAPNIKYYLLHNKHNKFGWVNHSINDYNDEICQYLIDIGWKITVNHLIMAAKCANIFAFDMVSDRVNDISDDEITKVLCGAIESRSPEMVESIMYRYNMISEYDIGQKITNITGYQFRNYIEYENFKTLQHYLGRNFNAKIHELLCSATLSDFDYVYFATKYGYFDMFVFHTFDWDNSDFTHEDIDHLILCEQLDLLYYVVERGVIFDTMNVETAILTVNIEILKFVIAHVHMYSDDDEIYVDWQITAIKVGIEMFKFIYKLRKIHNIKVSRAVFTHDDIEIMEYLHKHDWPISDDYGIVGLKFMHRTMGIILTPDMYVINYHSDYIKINKYITDHMYE